MMRRILEAIRLGVHRLAGSHIDGVPTLLLTGGFGFTVAAQLVVLLLTKPGTHHLAGGIVHRDQQAGLYAIQAA